MDGYVTIGTKVDLSGIQEGLASMQSLVSSKMTKMASTVKNAFSKISKVLSIYTIYRLATSFIDLNDAVSRVDTLNNYAKVMGNLGISAEDAEKSINILSDRLIGLPTTLDDAALAVQRFASTNNDIEVSTEMFLALNNAILAGGASAQIQKSALEQMSQAYAKGKPDMMEWRTAMMAMPAQLKQVATAMGYVNSQQLGEALRTNKVSMNEFMATIMKLNEEGLPGFQNFADQAKNATGGIRTALVNLKTAVTRALADIMNAIGQSNISEFINSIARAIQKAVPYVAAFFKALMLLFGITGKTNKSTAKASVSMDNLGTSSAGTSKKLKGATKSAKDLNKELKKLASFDEMNILDKLEKASSGSGGAGGGTVDMDMTPFENLGLDAFSADLDEISVKTEELVLKIMNFLGPLIANWELLISTIYGTKIALGLFGSSLAEIGLTGFAGEILVISGLIEFVIGIVEGDLLTCIQGLSIALAGLAAMMLSVNAANPVGWITLAIGVIGTVVTWIGKHNEKLSDEERAQRRVTDATKEAKNALDELRDAQQKYINAVDNADSAKKKLEATIKKYKLSTEQLNDIIKRGTEDYAQLNDIEKEIFKAYYNNETAQRDLKKSTKDLQKANEEEAKAAIKKQIAIADQKKDYEGLSQSITEAYTSGRISAEDAAELTALAMNKMSDATRRTFAQEIPNDILSALDTNAYAKGMNGLLWWWNENIKKMNGKITVKADVQTSGSFSKGGFAKGGIAYFSTNRLPRLASGGVINQPGRGVPIASAIGGERGMEGVIPLTDSQQMALLGEAIGKYITVNANIVNTMNGRVISRELQRVVNGNDFAYNR